MDMEQLAFPPNLVPPGDPSLPELELRYREWRATRDGDAVYREVCLRARALKHRGFTRFGLAAIWEAIRYDRSLELGQDAEGWKVNNSWRAFIAREVHEREPDLDGFFSIRQSIADPEEA